VSCPAHTEEAIKLVKLLSAQAHSLADVVVV
jgi:hypothetical protein